MSGIGYYPIGDAPIGGGLAAPSAAARPGGDIALVWDPANGRADFAMNATGTDLLLDGGLETAVIISLFCDRLADAADTIPDGTTDRRGWWGDTPLPNISDPSRGERASGTTTGLNLTGSRLWLLARSLQVTETLRRAESYAREALQWMIDDGIAGSIAASAVFPPNPPNALELTISIIQAGATQPTQFAFAWAP